MASVQIRPSILAELADFMASGPSPEQIIEFKPSAEMIERARELLLKQNEGLVTKEEQCELREFEHFEVFMRLLKTRLRARKAKKR